MKKQINLLLQQKDYKKKEKFFSIFRKITVLLGIATVLCLFTIFYIDKKTKTQYQILLSKKEDYLKQLILKKNVERQTVYFNEKSNLFNKILKEDINFLPYYRILKTYLPVSTQSADINSVKYDNKKTVEFALSFSNYEDLYNSISAFENEKFLAFFDELTLNSINLAETKTKNYQLSLKGKFKTLPVEP